MDNDLTYYKYLWEKRFPSPRTVTFADGVLVNEYCPGCRFCCGPQKEEKPFPMALLDSQISDRTPDNFYLLDNHTAALDRRGCKALTPSGCRLERKLRPVACNIFPIVLVNSRLYLYKVCPASLFLPGELFQKIAGKVGSMLNGFSARDVQRISITRDPSDLASKYEYLGISVCGK